MGIGKTLVVLKWVSKYFLFLAKLEGERRPFLEGARIDLSSKPSLTYGGNVYYCKSKCSSSSFDSACENREHLVSFQSKSVKLLFQMIVQVNSVLGQTEGERKSFNYSRAWSSKICGKIPGPVKRILLSTKWRSNNYLELPRENVSGIRKSSQKQPSCPKNMKLNITKAA